MALAKPHYQDLVFINCPFDPSYLPILRAIIFTIYRCGFSPISALSYDNGTQYRLEKINQCIASAQFGIHDISNIRLSKDKFPRFNMPFELGLFFGAKEFGGKFHQTKNAIIFDSSRYRYLQFISDLNGVDIKAHRNSAKNVIKHIRNWLRTASKRNDLPGAIIMQNEYIKIAKTIPALAKELGEKPEDIPYNDYCAIMESAVKKIRIAKL
jgi:hypothetical protein